MLWLFVLVTIIIIFPILVKINVYFLLDYKKLFIEIKLFGILPIINSFVEKKDNMLVFHLTKKIWIVLSPKNLLSMKKKVKPLKDYHIFKANIFIELGENDILPYCQASLIINYVFEHVARVILNKKPYIQLNNNIFIFEDQTRFNVYANFSVVFNLLMIILSIIKILTEKIIYAIRKSKQQNRQSS